LRKMVLMLLISFLFVSPVIYTLPALAGNSNSMGFSFEMQGVWTTSVSNANGKPPSPPGKPPKPPKGPLPNKWAVVIGVSKYEDSSANLFNPANDAKEMVKALETLYGFAEDNIKLLTDRRATASNIVTAIDWLVEKENDTSIVVFFYCGHGGQWPESETVSYGYPEDEGDGSDEYIVTYDMYAILDDYLLNKFSAIESYNFMLWFGSCHSGGMSPDLNAEGRVIVTACEEDEVGWDYRLLRNTLFGYYYIDEGMLDELADGYGQTGIVDGVVTVEEAFYYSQPLVTAEQHGQHPFIWDYDPTNDLNL